MKTNASSRPVRIRFWLVPPRRMTDRQGKVYRDARPALRVVASLRRGDPRIHIGWCSLPPTPPERAMFLATCAARLHGHGIPSEGIHGTVLGIEERLDTAIQEVHAAAQPGADGAHAALRVKALLLGGVKP